MKKLLYSVAVSAMMVGSALAGEVSLSDVQIDKVTAGTGQRDNTCCERTSIRESNTGDNSLNTNSGNNTANGGQYVDNSRTK